MIIKIVIIAALCFATAFTHAGEIDFSAYYKNFFTVNNTYDPFAYESDAMWVNLNTLRLNLSYIPSDNYSLNVSYSISPAVSGSGVSSFEDSTQQNLVEYRIFDIEKQYGCIGCETVSYAIMQNLDRAYFRASTQVFDLYAGRQPVALGVSRVISPTDVIMPFTFDALDTEERRGVDAFRLRVPLGMMSEIEATYIFGKDAEMENSAAFLKGRFYALETDFAFTLLEYRNTPLLGFDMMRSIGGAGTWLEATYTITMDSDVPRDPEDEVINKSFLRLSAGADYSFSDKTYGFFEYHYNGAGESNPGTYGNNIAKSAYIEGGVYLMGRHYLTSGGMYRLTPLITPFAQAMVNLNDGSFMLSASIDYSIAQDIYLAAGTFTGIGKTEVDSIGVYPISYYIKSEFGGYPDMYYASVRIYF